MQIGFGARRARRFGAVTAIVLAAGLSLAACGKSGDSDSSQPTFQATSGVSLTGSPTFDKIKSRGKVIIGVKDDQPNLGYKDPTTGKYSGFDISIADLIAAKLGYGTDKIEYKPVPSASREQAISNGDVDFYVGTYSINDKRKKEVGFAGPYFIAGQDLLVRKDDNSITGPTTLKGKTVCSATGSTPIQNIQDNAAKFGNPKIVQFDKYSQCVDGLLKKTVDAVTTDDAILKGYAAQQPDKLKVVGKPFSTEKYGIGLPKNDTVLRHKMNEIITTAENDGTWQKIYDATLGKSGSKATAPKVDDYS